MSTEFRPLIEILRELKALALKKASGFLFIVTDENHSCIVRLNAGQIEEVVFRMLRNDEAVQRLTMVNAAKARFQADPGVGDHPDQPDPQARVEQGGDVDAGAHEQGDALPGAGPVGDQPGREGVDAGGQLRPGDLLGGVPGAQLHHRGLVPAGARGAQSGRPAPQSAKRPKFRYRIGS